MFWLIVWKGLQLGFIYPDKPIITTQWFSAYTIVPLLYSGSSSRPGGWGERVPLRSFSFVRFVTRRNASRRGRSRDIIYPWSLSYSIIICSLFRDKKIGEVVSFLITFHLSDPGLTVRITPGTSVHVGPSLKYFSVVFLSHLKLKLPSLSSLVLVLR